LAAEILQHLKTDLGQLVLIPSGGGRFEVTLDDDLVFSKLEDGRFPEHDEILAKL